MRARDAADQRGIDCRRRSLAADVAHRDAGDALAAVFQEVVEVAADLARRRKARGHLGILEYRQLLRQQAELQLARQRQVLLQALLLPRDALVQRRVLDGDGHLRRHGGHDANVVFVEVIAAGVLDVEHADHLVFVDQRNAKLGAGLGIGLDVARIFADIGHQHGLPVLRGIADQANA